MNFEAFLPISEFTPLPLYLVISLLLSLILIGASFAFASKGPASPEKLSAYECGSHLLGDVRSLTFLFPWAVSLNKIGWFGFRSMMVFVRILTIGFLHEWKKGALDWE
ncbi:hypothetical protein KP509_23G013800 [Ceratopteris richardii]|uniref:NADH-ubiquinone oxidoreductase chain 3 n=1 Tax=Ceratopteris richardii TaxID=49495 RepID=A0A8T2RXK5_CERRI|nr:hypothetical protein KP509_23G013800 [Ceratopteris richardii]